MNIYIYSDESGVFDKVHNDLFVFAGLIILDKKEEWCRRYSKAENDIRKTKKVGKNFELKATNISNEEKSKLFRSLNNCYKFSVIINQKKVLNNIFDNKKSKQRYLDFAYKIGVKHGFQEMIQKGLICPKNVQKLFFYVDEHTTATNGCYELKESLEQEFKNGTYNWNYSYYFPPLFTNLQQVELNFCNSKSKLLVRAADIVANKIYYLSRTKQDSKLLSIQNFSIKYLP